MQVGGLQMPGVPLPSLGENQRVLIEPDPVGISGSGFALGQTARQILPSGLIPDRLNSQIERVDSAEERSLFSRF
jgi:hypothetical protein